MSYSTYPTENTLTVLSYDRKGNMVFQMAASPEDGNDTTLMIAENSSAINTHIRFSVISVIKGWTAGEALRFMKANPETTAEMLENYAVAPTAENDAMACIEENLEEHHSNPDAYLDTEFEPFVINTFISRNEYIELLEDERWNEGVYASSYMWEYLMDSGRITIPE